MSRQINAVDIARLPFRNIGTAIRTGVMAGFNNSTPKTFHTWQTVEQDFDSVRVLFANGSESQTYNIAAAKVCVSADPDVNPRMNGAAYVDLTFGGDATKTVPVARSTGGVTNYVRSSIVASDWVNLSSLARSDSGTLPVIACRVYVDTAATLSFVGSGSYAMDDWDDGALSDGRQWMTLRQDGDAVSTLSNLSSTTRRSQTPVLGFQYRARGRVVTVLTVGDSIDWGAASTLKSAGFIAPACWNVSDSETGIKVEHANLAWPSAVALTFESRLADFIADTGVIPDIVTFPLGSPNNMGGGISDSQITTQRRSFVNLLATCSQYNIQSIIRTIIPSNPAAGLYDWGASDSKRRDFNDWAREILVAHGAMVVDADNILAGPAFDGDGQITLLHPDATLHPDQTGCDLVIPLYEDVITNLIGITAGKLYQ